jgi:hypothetical protein
VVEVAIATNLSQHPEFPEQGIYQGILQELASCPAFLYKNTRLLKGLQTNSLSQVAGNFFRPSREIFWPIREFYGPSRE